MANIPEPQALPRQQRKSFPPKVHPSDAKTRPHPSGMVYKGYQLPAYERPSKYLVQARIQDEDLYMTPSPTVMSHSQPDMTDMDLELSGLPNSSSSDEDAGSPPHSPQQSPAESRLRQKKPQNQTPKEGIEDLRKRIHHVVEEFKVFPTIPVLNYLRARKKDFDSDMQTYLKQNPKGEEGIRKKYKNNKDFRHIEAEEWQIHGIQEVPQELVFTLDNKGKVQAPELLECNHLNADYFKSLFLPGKVESGLVNKGDINVLISQDQELRANFYKWCSTQKKKNNLVKVFNTFLNTTSFPAHKKQILITKWLAFHKKVNLATIEYNKKCF